MDSAKHRNLSGRGLRDSTPSCYCDLVQTSPDIASFPGYSPISRQFWVAIVASAFFALPTLASASTSTPGRASHVLVMNGNGKVFFNHSGSRNGTPTCASVQRWVFDASTPAGQAILSSLLTFETRGTQFSVNGTGACADWGDTETVSYIEEVP